MSAANYVTNGPTLEVRVEGGVWWATCPGCPNWSVAADSWADLFHLVDEWHKTEAPHRAWTMIAPPIVFREEQP